MRAPSIGREKRGLADSVEADFRMPLPVLFAIPKLHAFNNAAFTGQIDGTCGSAVRDALADGEFFCSAISEMDHQSAEFDGAAAYAKLDGAEPAV